MSPRQKVMWFLNQINDAGKDRAREFFEMAGGKYVKEFVELYNQDWETTHSGNNARLVKAIVEKILPELEEKFGKKNRSGRHRLRQSCAGQNART